MSRSMRAVAVCLAATGLLVAGCWGGGGHPPAKKTQVKTSTPAASVSTPPPSYTAEHVTQSLITAKDVAPEMSPRKPDVAGFQDGAAETCKFGSVVLPGKPQGQVRQFEDPQNLLLGIHYDQLVAVYDDHALAVQAFAELKAKVAACPAKGHVESKQLSGNQVRLEYDFTWVTSEDTMLGWDHIRGIEKHVNPPYTPYNATYLIYDYAIRGNVVIATGFWQKLKPDKPVDPLAKQATDLLAKQFTKIG